MLRRRRSKGVGLWPRRWRRCARHKCVTSVKRGLCLWPKRSICGAKETCYYRRDLLLVRWHAGGMRKRQKRPAHMAKETGLRRKRDLLLHCHTGIPEDVAHGAHTVQRPIYSKDDREVRDVLVQACAHVPSTKQKKSSEAAQGTSLSGQASLSQGNCISVHKYSYFCWTTTEETEHNTCGLRKKKRQKHKTDKQKRKKEKNNYLRPVAPLP